LTTDLFDATGLGPVLRVHVQPGARSTGIVGVHGDALKVRLAAPPHEGRANQALLTLLAERFGCERSGLVVVSGTSARRKRVRFEGVDAADFEARLRHVLGDEEAD
jgi:uncharacterized protein